MLRYISYISVQRLPNPPSKLYEIGCQIRFASTRDEVRHLPWNVCDCMLKITVVAILTDQHCTSTMKGSRPPKGASWLPTTSTLPFDVVHPFVLLWSIGNRMLLFSCLHIFVVPTSVCVCVCVHFGGCLPVGNMLFFTRLHIFVVPTCVCVFVLVVAYEFNLWC